MKKTVKITAALIITAALLGSCSDNSGAGKNAMIDAIISEAVSSAEAENSAVIFSAEEKAAVFTAQPDTTAAPGPSAGNVDIDLTKMNATMIYSIIYDLMVKPNDYYGKTLMVDGYFDTVVNEQLGVRYFFVVVPDATACCAQGLEFKRPEDRVYPDDYPEPGKGIRVRGVLGSYEENGQPYAYINADAMSLI
ncbi:MAG: hypothetical protein J6X60_01555 [Ruminiclostridium sp.]|nr:hypothetical protein [Ruminiclostridium sp.]